MVDLVRISTFSPGLRPLLIATKSSPASPTFTARRAGLNGSAVATYTVGPVGAGHHGPGEWVSVSSLETYWQALESFLRAIPDRLDD